MCIRERPHRSPPSFQLGPRQRHLPFLLRVFLGSFSSASAFTLLASVDLRRPHHVPWAIWQRSGRPTSSGCLPTHPSLMPAMCWWESPPAGSRGISGVMYYLVAYALMNVGVFILIAYLSGAGERLLEIEDYKGLAYARPGWRHALPYFFCHSQDSPPLQASWASSISSGQPCTPTSSDLPSWRC